MVPLPAPLIVNRSVPRRNSLQGIKRRAERMIGHVRCRRRVTGGARRRDRGFSLHASRGRVRGYGGFLCVAYLRAAVGPRPAYRDGIARALIVTASFENRQDVFRAIRRPFGQKTMPRQVERTASMRRDESPISKSACARSSFPIFCLQIAPSVSRNLFRSPSRHSL